MLIRGSSFWDSPLNKCCSQWTPDSFLVLEILGCFSDHLNYYSGTHKDEQTFEQGKQRKLVSFGRRRAFRVAGPLRKSTIGWFYKTNTNWNWPLFSDLEPNFRSGLLMAEINRGITRILLTFQDMPNANLFCRNQIQKWKFDKF